MYFLDKVVATFNLTELDRAVFAGLGITEETLRTAHLRRVTHAEAEELGFKCSGDLSGIVFPYFSRDGHARSARLRRDQPDIVEGKLQAKYLSRYGDDRSLYFPAGCYDRLAEAKTVVIVEAEKSVLALTEVAQRNSRDFLTVACGGCYGWMGRTGREKTPNGNFVDIRGPIGDLDSLLKCGEIVICFDSNSNSNSKVQTARRKLASYLTECGAVVRIIDLPCFEGVNGPDDLIKVAGDKAFLELLDAAQPFHSVAIRECEAAVSALPNDPPLHQREDVLHLLAAVRDRNKREMLVDLASGPLNTGKAELRKMVGLLINENAGEQNRKRQAARRQYLLRKVEPPARLIRDLEAFFQQHVYLPDGAALALAFWVLNTWTFNCFDTTPYLSIESATRGCGKTTLLECLEAVCSSPLRTVGMTEAVLFRLIQERTPTLLIDEAETVMGGTDRAEAIRSVANSGYKKGSKVHRASGEGNAIQEFNAYCPKAFAAIAGLEGALGDRCIVVSLEKAPPGIMLQPSRSRTLERRCAPLRERCEAYAVQMESILTEYYEKQPDEGYWPKLRNREAELWGPLLTHAAWASEDLEAELLEIAVRFSKLKATHQTEEAEMAKARDVLRVLEGWSHSTFQPRDLVGELESAPGWAADFDRINSQAAKAVKIGRFLTSFRLQRDHCRSGSSYLTEAVMKKLRLHVPDADLVTG